MSTFKLGFEGMQILFSRGHGGLSDRNSILTGRISGRPIQRVAGKPIRETFDHALLKNLETHIMVTAVTIRAAEESVT